MKILLKKPVNHGSAVITELTFREEIVSGDLRGVSLKRLLSEFETDAVLKVAGRLCAQPDTVMNALGMEDTFSVAEAITVFLVRGLPTGSQPSP